MHRFYAPRGNFTTDTVSLEADETHHLKDVLRLSVGDEVQVMDGEGREYACRIDSVTKAGSVLSIAAEVQPASPESPLDLTVAATVIPGDNYDLIVQKAVELGVYHLVPLHTSRCEIRLKDAIRRLDRWRRIALGATKQCGRARLMTIGQPLEFSELIKQADPSRTLFFSERDGRSFGETHIEGDHITAIFGPKGGWEDDELMSARAKKVAVITLGGRIMRAETAAIAITALVQNRWGDLS